MAHPLLGKWIQINGVTMKIGFLRADCDAGVIDAQQDKRIPPRVDRGKSLLVRLSDQSVIRELEPGEDYDAAVLAAKPK